jgi:hypothetical protein
VVEQEVDDVTDEVELPELVEQEVDDSDEVELPEVEEHEVDDVGDGVEVPVVEDVPEVEQDVEEV